MNSNEEFAFFESAILQVTGVPHQILESHRASGGNINQTVKISTDQGLYFLKWNHEVEPDFFEKEWHGLEQLKATGALAVPKAFGTGKIGNTFFLLMECIQSGSPKKTFWKHFGAGLARQHKHHAEKFGWTYNNHIGKLPQRNTQETDWITFFIEHRLEPQLGLAIYNDQIDNSFARRFRNLYAQFPGLFPTEPASLLHGDLWSGNFLVGRSGEAWIFDPAVYFGNREIELAFTNLFGGFDREFYQSYSEEYPLEPEFSSRIDLYNLYPLLVHVNLFGKSYLSGIERTLKRFL